MFKTIKFIKKFKEHKEIIKLNERYIVENNTKKINKKYVIARCSKIFFKKLIFTFLKADLKLIFRFFYITPYYFLLVIPVYLLACLFERISNLFGWILSKIYKEF